MLQLEPSRAIVVAALAALLVELGLFWAGVSGLWVPLASVGTHLALVAVMVMWTTRSPVCRADLRLPLLLTLAVAFMGPFGAAGTLLTIAMAKRYAKSTPPFEVWYAALFPEESAIGSTNEEWKRLVANQDDGRQTSVTPFSDILGFGSLSQKQELLTVISRQGGISFAPILRLAIDDANNGIRVQAASAIARIEDEFLPREAELMMAVGENPMTPDPLMKLGRLYDEYSSAGILDEARERDCRSKALAVYADYLTLCPDDSDARVAVGRVLLADQRFDDATRWMEPWLAQDGSSVTLLLLYMEALFRLNQFDQMRQVVAQHREAFVHAENLSIEASETIKLWLQAVA